MMGKLMPLLVGALLGLSPFVCSNAGAFEEITHRNISQQAIAYLIAREGYMPSRPSYQLIANGSVEEDQPSSRSFFHFSPPLNSWYASADCDTMSWAFYPAVCTVKVLRISSTFSNEFNWPRAVAQADTDAGWVGLGHVLHLLQDMAVPAHTRNDPHPWGDTLEAIAEEMPTPLFNEMPVIVADPEALVRMLRDYTQRRHFSSDTCFDPDLPGPTAVHEDDSYFLDINGRAIAYKGLAYIWSENKRYATINSTIAQEQFRELGPLAVLYAASLIKRYYEEAGLSEDSMATRWVKTFPKRGHEYGASVQQTTDKGYIIGGSTAHSVPGGENMWLIKTNGKGNVQWEREYGGLDPERGHSVKQTADGGYIFTGTTMDGPRMVLMKTDPAGVPQWEKAHKIMQDTMGMGGVSVEIADDGGYVVAGSAWTKPNDYPYITEVASLMKTDRDGNIVWETAFGGFTCFLSVTKTSDGGFVAVGNSSEFIYMVKVDKRGAMRWERLFAHGLWNEGIEVRSTSDGGFIIAGDTMLPKGLYRAYLIKTDSVGRRQWERVLGTDRHNAGRSVQQTSDGGYIVAGFLRRSTADPAQVSLVKTDAEGNVRWSRAHSVGDNAWGSSVRQTHDGGYVVTGCTCSWNGSECDIFLMKTDGQGNI